MMPPTSSMPQMQHMPAIRFAIIDANMLTCLGLQQLLTDLLPMAEVVVCKSLGELQQEDTSFIHYFVSSSIYFEHTAFFRQHPHKSIVLVAGDMMINGVFTLNVCQNMPSLIRDVMALQNKGHMHGQTDNLTHPHKAVSKELILSSRELEVAVLLCKGYINKEVADRLNISLTTAITHRKNIMDKLHARSLADIIIYCIVNGIVNVEDL